MDKKERAALKELSREQLVEKLGQLRRDYFSVRLQSKTAHVKDYSQFCKLRRGIARVMTLLHAQELSEENHGR